MRIPISEFSPPVVSFVLLQATTTHGRIRAFPSRLLEVLTSCGVHGLVVYASTSWYQLCSARGLLFMQGRQVELPRGPGLHIIANQQATRAIEAQEAPPAAPANKPAGKRGSRKGKREQRGAAPPRQFQCSPLARRGTAPAAPRRAAGLPRNFQLPAVQLPDSCQRPVSCTAEGVGAP
ncbi:hypothetical protein VOLCADRAFT_95874 [Volvox carteri f. nagariensis]|uniref:Uncharacterized protein n=1 Tax=Volvox carteri f. nagariensis TaxID=3068 RepID=D8U8L7_VOLCA|nr:uncharacterized protein VOLCADRAFT_95874 [Volvox carteri f. nagariensis]EFJ44004.1 hypothetical protein VOLCADRAFT_95874 [Volvox carteri f. nagariensis]|eukprot:XP_002955016.1 hypothetical protein VOLCADRAFT_95874 [Volvox carteri f. nagariensis]